MQHIKQLVVENFKSYRGRQVIGPFNKFTAIIGPNGAGKSNLLEAISFVFGVKAANLRGSQLDDLFCKYADPSTEKCYVKVYFFKKVQNDDSEHSFERRLNLSRGISEFYIDGVSVSWASYEEQLASYNILVKSKNFLVFQGDVEVIAQKSPKELTLLIEHISESVRYKEEYDRLRQEHAKAVENGKFLLTQQKSLKLERRQYRDQQAEVVQYNQILEQQKNANLQYFLCQLYYCGKNLEEIRLRKSKKLASLDQVVQKLEPIKAQQVIEKRQLSERQLRLSKLKKQCESVKSELFKRGPAVEAKKRELDVLRRRVASATSDMTRVEQFERAQVQVISNLESELRECEEMEQQYLASEEATLREAAGVKMTAEQLEEWARLKDEVALKNREAHSQLAQLCAQKQIDDGACNVLKMNLDAIKVRRDGLADQLGELERRSEEIIRSIVAAKGEKTKNENDLATQRLETQRRNEELSKYERELSSIQDYLKQAGYATLECTRRNRFDEYLTSMKRLFPGVHGKIVDLVKPVANHYKPSLIVVLGTYLDAIVVSERKTAMDCIQYMREHRVGTCTILPLDSLECDSVDDEMRSLGLDSKPLIDVLTYDRQYQKAVEFVCGSTVLCRDLESARQLAFGRVKHKVVTLDGELIGRNGVMSGGRSSSLDFQMRKWQDSEIKQKKSRRDELQSLIAKCVSKSRSALRDQDFEQTLQQTHSKISTLTYEQDLVQRRIESIQSALDDVNKSAEALEAQIAELSARQSSNIREIQTVQQKIHSVENEFFAPFASRMSITDMREWERVQKSAERRSAERSVKFSYQRSRIENLLSYERQRLRSCKHVDDLKAEIDSSNSMQNRLCQELESEEAALKKLVEQVDRCEVEIDASHVENDKLEFKLLSLSKDVENLNLLKTATAKSIDGIDGEYLNELVRRHDIYLQCIEDEVELPIDSGQQHLPKPELDFMTKDVSDMQKVFANENDIKIDFSKLPEQHRNRSTPSEIQELHSELSNALKAYSAKLDKMMPNMNAENYLVNLQTRIGEIDDKVCKARQEEIALRNEFDKVRFARNQTFMNAFTCISNNIDGIYKQLTNEFGVAHLIVDSNDEPYLHAVRYTAVPRHKTFRNIDDLSGGEKSIAALALLFAIHSYRPSPFFILDEIDASLDRNNVKIVVKYIQEASLNTQFLLISLKETCYEKADSLVGIYVDRSNPPKTSKTLSLDLTQFEE